MILLSTVISYYFEQSYIHREMNYMSIAMDEVTNYIGENKKLVKKLVYNMYVDCFYNNEIYTFLRNSKSPEIEASYRKVFYNYIKNLFANYKYLQTIEYYRKADNEIFKYSYTGNEQKSYTTSGTIPNYILNNINKVSVIGKDSNQGYYFAAPFNNIKTFIPLGYFTFEFGNQGIDEILRKYTKNFKCNFILTTKDTIFYNLTQSDTSTSALNTTDFLNTSKVYGTLTLCTFKGIQYYILEKEDKSLGIRAYCIIKKSEIELYTKPVRAAVITSTFIAGLLFIIFLFFGNRVFSSRMNSLIKQINQMRRGSLLDGIEQEEKLDELGIISSHFNLMCKELQEYINKTYLYEIKKKNAEYKLLQMQINPHFLFNTLEVIRMKSAIEGNTEASQMIYNFAMLMRQTAKQDSVSTLEDEIAFCKCYLDLFAPQFKNSLLYEVNIPKECRICGIIRHTLQPLLENSIVHAFNEEKTVNKIVINITRIDNDLMIYIIDNGTGIEESVYRAVNEAMASDIIDIKNENIGLQNVNDRIKLIYGNSYGIKIQSSPGKGTEVQLRLKFLSYNEVLELVQIAHC
jgi:Predicted signal transduction protein with a C-terminal ATPase domain